MTYKLTRRDVLGGLALLGIAGCKTAETPKVAVPVDDAVKPVYNPKALVELIKMDRTIKLDLRYATTNNFTGRVLYPTARAFMAKAAAEALLKAHRAALDEGYGFSIYDAYRPWTITKALWDATPADQKDYVANPKRGSRHNRGCAVDLTLYDLKTGALVEMPSEFDDFSKRAHRDYMETTPRAIENRARLERLMTAQGFIGMSNEWWHFDFAGWQDYPVLDVPFDKI
jgi:zinc D-Ala-D-Ala dipeptidase